MNKYSQHKKFIEQNKKVYISHLYNSNKEVTEQRTSEEITNILNEDTVINRKDIFYFCNKTSSVVSFGYSAFVEKAKKSLEDIEVELKEEGIYEDHLNGVFRSQSLVAMLEFLRFYELTFIKRYFLKILLDDISNGTYKTIKDFNILKRDMNFIKVQYDVEILFFTEGSAKELYISILNKSGTNDLMSKAEELVKGVREDVSNFRELEVKNNETLILILTSLLTILLGYRGIKYITYDVLVNLPYIGKIVSAHPLRFTLLLWGVLTSFMIWLNYKRWKFNK